MIGRTFDHYRIESKLGQGGMGVVYKARDARLDRPVAIKVLPPEKVADPERKRRFIQEAKAASALNHPNIITIHDINCADGVDFIVMEGALDGKRVGERNELLTGEGAADDLEEVCGQVGDVAESFVLDLLADAVGAAEQVGLVDAALIAASGSGHMNYTRSR